MSLKTFLSRLTVSRIWKQCILKILPLHSSSLTPPGKWPFTLAGSAKGLLANLSYKVYSLSCGSYPLWFNIQSEDTLYIFWVLLHPPSPPLKNWYRMLLTLICFFVLFCGHKTISLCSPGCPQISHPPAPASRVLDDTHVPPCAWPFCNGSVL